MAVSPGGDCYLTVKGGVVKYGPSGAQQWFRPLGNSTNLISPVAITLGSGDVVYVTAPGSLSNAVQVITFALSSAGEILWTGYVESTGGWGEPRDVQVDPAGNVYVCGQDYGDVFLLKYNAQGALLWKRTYDDFNLDIGEAMTIDSSGNVCIVASSWFLELYTWVMTLKYNSSGDLLWATNYGPTGTYFPAPYYAIATDASNNVVVGTTGGYESKYLLLKYSADGIPVWTNIYTGSAGDDVLVDIDVDQPGNVYATGASAGVQDHITTLKFGPDGRRHWTARDQPFVQAASGSSPVGIIVHEDGYVYVGGHTKTAQGHDFVALKYSTNGTLLWSVPVHNAAFGTADICRDIEMDAAGAIYLTGLSWPSSTTESEVFTVKLQQTDWTNLPTIIEPPRSATIVLAANPQVATFSVSASSDTPLTFQWRRDGAIIAGATNSTYTINNVTEQNEGGYSVIVSNAFGGVVTAEATLDVAIPPSIVSQPRDTVITVGREIGFDVQAVGDSPLFFQWQLNGENIPNATNRWISFNPVRPEHAGAYRVIVSNAVGVAISASATLTVTQGTRLDRWTWRHPIPTNLAAPNLHAITEARNRLIAVGNLGTILLSIDGIAWTNITTSVDEDLRGIAFGHNTFVAVGFAGTVMTSRDGFSWEARTVATNHLYGVAFLNHRFIAVGEAGTIVTSVDGLEWFTPAPATSERLKGIAYGLGLYIATGRDGTFVRSYDATNWTASADEQIGYIKGIAFANGLFAAVSADRFMTSTNGTNWSISSFGGYPEFENTAYAEGQPVVAGQQGLVMSWRINLGWTRHLVPTGKTIRDLIYARGCVWAVGNDGLIIQSGQLRPYLRVVPNAPSGATLSIRAEPGHIVRIEVSSNLRDWEQVATVIGQESPVLYQDNAGGHARFYRSD